MPYNLEIWVSRGGGITDADFSLLTTQTNATVGAEFDFTDAAETPGVLCAYRSRYVCAADATITSDWSPLAFARAPYPIQKGKSMSCSSIVTAGRTQLVVGVEGKEGQCVIGGYGLDALSNSLAINVENAKSQAHRNTPSAISSEVRAASSVSGDITFDLRPAGAAPRVLLTGYAIDPAFNIVEVAAVGTPGQPGYVAAHRTLKLIPTFVEQETLTLIDKRGDVAYVFSGGKMNTLSIDFDKTAKTPIRATVAMMCLDARKYPASTSGDLALLGLNAISYDNGEYGPTDWALSVGGVQNDDCRKVTHSLNRNLQPKEVGNYFIGASCYYADTSAVTASADLFWDSMDDVQQWWGQLPTVGNYYGVTKNILTTEVRVTAKPPAGPDGVVDVLEIVYPVCSVSTLTMPVPESGAIMQTIGYEPYQDPANNFRDHYILLTTTETVASLTAPQPEIAYAPKTAMYPYSAVPVTVAAGATSTVIASAANAFLSATNAAYVGLSLQFTTGALKGQSRVITGYVAASRTFTVGSAFTAAPATGDTAIVVGGDL